MTQSGRSPKERNRTQPLLFWKKASSRPPPKEEAISSQPSLLGDSEKKIEIFENAEQRTKGEVVEIRPHLTSPKKRNRTQPLLFEDSEKN